MSLKGTAEKNDDADDADCTVRSTEQSASSASSDSSAVPLVQIAIVDASLSARFRTRGSNVEGEGKSRLVRLTKLERRAYMPEWELQKNPMTRMTRIGPDAG
jgi:hypothetical protein